MHARVSMSWVGCSSSASASWCWRPTPASTLRAGRAPRTRRGSSSARTSCALGGRTLAPPVLIRCVWRARATAVASATRRPGHLAARSSRSPTAAGGRRSATVVYGEAELLRRDPPPARACGCGCRRCSRSTPRRPTPTRSSARRSTSTPTRELARVFVPTPAWQPRRRRPASAHNFLVLTGPPEMGKTAIARMLGLALLTAGLGGARVHPARAGRDALRPRPRRSCSSPTTRSARPSTGRTPPSAGRTSSTAILRATDEHHWLVWTSRPAPLRAGLRRLHRERGGERFPQPGGGAGRRLRARRRGEDADPLPPRARRGPPARAARADPRRTARRSSSTRTSRPSGSAASSRAARRVERRSSASCASRPRRWRRRYAALEPEHRELLFAMLDSPPGPVAERDLADALRRHATQRAAEGAGRPRRPARRPLPAGDRDEGRLGASELARPRDRVAGRPTPTRAAASSRAAASTARRSRSPASGGAAGERERPLLRGDADWDALGDGLLPPLPRARRGRGDPAAAACSPTPATYAEVRALARLVLDRLGWGGQGGQRRRDRRLGGRSRRKLDPRPEPPAVAMTWLELEPSRRAADAARSSSASRTGCGSPSCSPSTTRSCSRGSASRSATRDVLADVRDQHAARRAAARARAADRDAARGSRGSTGASPARRVTSREALTLRGDDLPELPLAPTRSPSPGSRSSGCCATC